MKFFEKIVYDIQPLPFFAKSLILDVWKGCQYASVKKIKFVHYIIGETDLKKRVEHNVHFHAPVFMRSEIKVYRVDYRFVSVINSHGVAFIVRDPFADLDKTGVILSSLASCWPAILIIVAFSMVAGIVIWVLVSTQSHPEMLCKKGVLKMFTEHTGKILCLSLFLIKW